IDYYRPVTTTGAGSKVYCGPTLNQDFAEQIMQVDGVTAYNGELGRIICADNIELAPGMGSFMYEEKLNDPERMNLALSRKDQMGSWEFYQIQHITAYM